MNGLSLGWSRMLVVAGVLVAAGSLRAQTPAPAVETPAVEAPAAPVAPAVEAPAAPVAPAVEAPAAPVAPAVEAPAAPQKAAPEAAPAHTGQVVHSITPPAAEAVAVPEGVTDEAAWAATSWQIGTRYTEVRLQDKTRGTPGNGSYFGTITGITEKQDGWPNKAYVQYRLFKSPVWLGVSYDHVVATTMDDSNGDGLPDSGGSDGDEEIQGAIPYLQAAWDNSTRLTPFAEIGFGFYEAKFQPNSWGDNGRRWVDAKKNVTGVELAGGLNIRLYKNISADLFAKYMKIDDIKGDWYYNHGNHGGPFVMTMSYMAYGAGLNWRF